MGSDKGREGKYEPKKRRRVPSPDKGPGRKSYRRRGGEAELDERRQLPNSDKQRKGLGSYRGREGKSEPVRRRRVPSPDKDLGPTSYRRKRGEAELDERKRLPSSDNQQNKATTDQREMSLRGGKPPLDSYPPDERTSAFMHSERLRETTSQKDESLIGRRPQPMNSPDERASASMLASDELPPDLAGTRLADADRKGETPTDKQASAFMYAEANKTTASPWEVIPELTEIRRVDAEAEEEDEVGEGTDTDNATKIADRRNLDRVDKADEMDRSLLSKYYLPDSIDEFLPNVIPGPDDSFVPPAWLMKAIEEVAASEVQTPLAPPVRFDLSDESVKFNSELLKESNLDLEEFLAKHQQTTLNFGSEFRPINDLTTILGSHPNFDFFSDVLENGMDYRFTEELSEDQRQAEVAAMMERGNHKSAQEDSEAVAKLLAKDVLQGFSLPVSPDLIPDMAHAMVQPAGVVKQFSLQEDGSRTLKRRLTQDLSFPLTSPKVSVNKRIDMSEYVEMIYGWCLSRIIHFIVALRLAYPLLRIFIMKYDYSDAYRRVAHSPLAAAQSVIIFARVAYIALRLTFGGSPNPPTWCAFSEMVTDLSNEIPLCKEWDHDTLRSPDQPETPAPSLLPDEVPIAKAMPMAVHVPTTVTARTDSFIDDLIRVFLDTPRNRAREPHAVPLAIHVTSRPHAGDAEPIKRRELVSKPKLIAEGGPAEAQIVLGWTLNTRSLLVILPSDKFEAWSSDLRVIISERRGTFGELETTIGRLNHAAYIIPLSRHFLNRIRLRLRVRQHKNQALSLTQDELDDFELWVFFLSQARAGISMNQLTIRQPTKICWSDSCPFGIGGFLLSGRAWRIRIPDSSPIYGLDIANNVLEFLGMMVTIWLVLIECEETGSEQDCILALGDNTSAIGWLFKSGKLAFDSPYYKAVQIIARKLARLITSSSHCLASQHIKGDKNTVSDLLSFAGDTRGEAHPLAPDYPSDQVLTKRFHSCIPQLIPANFNISPLPSEISCFVIQVLQTLESSLTPSKSQPTRRKTESGDAGSRSAPRPASTLTLSSLNYCSLKPSLSCAPFCPSTEWLTGAQQEPFLASVRGPWFRQLCAMPQAIWLRRSGVVSNGAPFTSKEAPSYSPPFGPF
jgi:hypothetical protein